MCIESYDGSNLGVCFLCAFCKEQKHPSYYCLLGKDYFGKITDKKHCTNFKDIIDKSTDFII